MKQPKTRRRWVTCLCGKTRQMTFNEYSKKVAKLRFNLAQRQPCKTCSEQISRQLNMCPEHIVHEFGVTACSLPYHHVGKCKPFR